MAQTILRGNLVLPNQILSSAELTIEDGKIAEIRDAQQSSSREYDAAVDLIDVGKSWILPGLIDPHVHAYSGGPDGEGLERLTKAAAVGGITTIIDMPFDAPIPVRHVERLREKIAQVEQEALIDVALYGTCAKYDGWSQITELARGGVCGFKFSTYESDPDRFPEMPDAELVKIFQELNKVGLVALFHAENGAIIDPLIEELRATGTDEPRAHAWSRPLVSETTAVLKLLELARVHSIKLHIAHLTAPFGYDALNWFRQTGVNATAETCIQYLVLDESDLTRLKGFAKCNPPLRTKKVQEQLWEKVLAGEVDFITSDHAPWPQEDKEHANIFANKSGLPGVDFLAPLFYSEAVVKRGLSINRFAELLSTAPAKRFGLYPRKGALQVGSDADITIIDPTINWAIDGSKTHSIAGTSPYDAREITGKISHTFVRGQLTYDGVKVCGQPGWGQFVRPLV